MLVEYEYEIEYEYEHEYEYILSIFSGLTGERGDFENDSMRETPL